MEFKNVSKHVIRALRDACDRVLAGECDCGHDESFVLAVGVEEECAEIARVDVYSEFDVAGPEYRVPLREALQIVAKYLAMSAWHHGDGPGDRLGARLLAADEDPLMWRTGEPMQLREHMSP
jgi:hypothetical protein